METTETTQPSALMVPNVVKFVHPAVEVYYESRREGVRPVRTRVSIAYKVDENGVLTCGMAFTSPTDNFMKKRGRAIAQGRLERHPITVETLRTLNRDEALQMSLSQVSSNLPCRWKAVQFV